MFTKGHGREPLNVTETEIRYAMEHTRSCAEAARFLSLSYDTYKKYARYYVDKVTGKTLFDLHKNQRGKGISKSAPKINGRYGLKEILNGAYPNYSGKKLKARLIRSEYIEEKCCNCDFNERRVMDYSIPLMLDWIDGDKTNHKLENIRLLCFNCYYLLVGNLNGKQKNWDKL
jgi:hypothetical protein